MEPRRDGTIGQSGTLWRAEGESVSARDTEGLSESEIEART